MSYKERKINFLEVETLNKWSIKIYTITMKVTFAAESVIQASKKQLNNWLTDMNSFDANHEHMAFLIVHECAEGVFVLINTWVGNNMLQRHIYITHDGGVSFKKISGDGLCACIWELEIIHFESKAWTKHVVTQNDNPDYQKYLEESLNTIL